MKGAIANIDRAVQGLNGAGGQSASKQIGAHLLQMQQTAAKQSRGDNQSSLQQWDLIALLRHLGQAYQL